MRVITTIVLVATVSLFACKSKPKVITEESSTPTTENKVATTDTTANTNNNTVSTNDVHSVVALEILQADRYTYLRVKENTQTFWIATVKFEPKVGNTYLYRGGLLKTNFESQEHKRTFDKIFLVSEIIDAAKHPAGESSIPNNTTTTTAEVSANMKAPKDALKISDLLKNKEKYSGKSVVVYGKCVKANYGIMNRNWIHIQDGSKNGGAVSELTITTNENIPLGAIVAFEGKVVLNKDFGAGYKYDIIVEEAKLH